MSNARTLNKLLAFQINNLETMAYGNEAGTFTTARGAIDWLFAALYPNTQDSVDIPADLPSVGNTLNDYRVVLDDGDGKAAGYRWEQREGEASPSWHKIHDMDWSSDAILSSFQDVAQDLYVHKNGRMDLDASGNPLTGFESGQKITGGTDAGSHLTLEANSGDGTGAESGYVQLNNSLRATSDDALDLGTLAERFRDLFINGVISDGTDDFTVAEAADAYDHSQIISGNPHGTSYNDLSTQLGTLTVDGDASGTVDLSTSGDKTLTLTVADNSHNHTASNITDFSTATYTKVKAVIQNGTGITFTANDGLETLTPAVSISTAQVTDVDAPAANKIMVGNAAGDTWVTSDGAIELTGDVTGTANYNSTTDKWEIATSVTTAPPPYTLDNKTYTGATGNPTNVPATAHGLTTGETVRMFGDITGEYAITLVDANNFTIVLDTPGTANGYYIPQGAQLQYDTATDEFKVAKEYEEIRLGELQGLDEDVLDIYVAKDGRTGGQTIKGGISASENLVLSSTNHATKGTVQTADSFTPVNTAAYSGGWTGTDLGATGKKWNDLYIAGEAKGLRLENVGSLPTSSGTTVGRAVFYDGSPWFDTGSEYVQAGGGGGPLVVAAKSSNYTIVEGDGLILASNSIVITLPAVASVDAGSYYRIKNVGSGIVTVDGSGSETIDGELAYSIETQYHCITVCTDGTGWHII